MTESNIPEDAVERAAREICRRETFNDDTDGAWSIWADMAEAALAAAFPGLADGSACVVSANHYTDLLEAVEGMIKEADRETVPFIKGRAMLAAAKEDK